jgi:sulfatase modifying factor 1
VIKKGRAHIMKQAFFLSVLLLAVCHLFFGDEKGLLIKEIKGNEGRRWALCIGINDYWDDKVADLKKARNDAKSLAGVLESMGQFDKVYTMTDDLALKDRNYPSKFNIESRIDYVMNMASREDLIVFSFSGHGISNENGAGYLVSAYVRIEKPFDTSLALDYIVDKLKKKKIAKSLLLIDACREEMEESKGLKAGGFHASIYSKAEIAAVFYATKAGWFSYEDKKSDYGIFSRFLIEGLKGKADADKDGIVSFSELETYVMEAVFDYAVEMDRKQCPYTKIYGEKFGDLALTAVKGRGAAAVEKEERKEDKGLVDMVYVEGGTFKMGSTSGDDDERPVHTVTITNDFWIGKYEVTQAEWKEVMGSNPSRFIGDNLPVERVSWYDAVEFCNRLSDRDGLTRCYSGNSISCDFNANGYRFPTEAEWEFAARGGNKSRDYKYSGSNSAFDVGWYNDNAGGKTHPVVEKKANELGLYDMSGNVWEWCWDWYVEYSSSSQKNPLGASSGGSRVLRGGSLQNSDWKMRTARRCRLRPGNRNDVWGLLNLGFRVARSR